MQGHADPGLQVQRHTAICSSAEWFRVQGAGGLDVSMISGVRGT